MTAECKSGSPSFHPRQEDVESKIVSGFFQFLCCLWFALHIALEAGVDFWHNTNASRLSLRRILLDAKVL